MGKMDEMGEMGGGRGRPRGAEAPPVGRGDHLSRHPKDATQGCQPQEARLAPLGEHQAAMLSDGRNDEPVIWLWRRPTKACPERKRRVGTTYKELSGGRRWLQSSLLPRGRRVVKIVEIGADVHSGSTSRGRSRLERAAWSRPDRQTAIVDQLRRRWVIHYGENGGTGQWTVDSGQWTEGRGKTAGGSREPRGEGGEGTPCDVVFSALSVCLWAGRSRIGKRRSGKPQQKLNKQAPAARLDSVGEEHRGRGWHRYRGRANSRRIVTWGLSLRASSGAPVI